MNDSIRYNWVDSLKGFGILLMVLNHAIPDHILFFKYDVNIMKIYIQSFHVPLFFFISGFLFNSAKWIPKTKDFLISRFNSVLVPYFIFMTLSIIANVLYSAIINHVNAYSIHEISILIFHILYAHYEYIYLINGALWFLPALFLSELIYFTLEKALKRRLFVIVSVVILASIGAYFGYPFKPPWHINSALVALMFYASGKLFQNYKDNFFQIGNVIMALIFCTQLSLAFRFIYDLQSCLTGNLIVYYLTAMSGILFYTFLFYVIGSRLPLLTYFGKNSIIILCTHWTFIVYIHVLLNIQGIAPFFLTMLFEIPTISIINKYMPWSTGKPFRSLVADVKLVDSMKHS